MFSFVLICSLFRFACLFEINVHSFFPCWLKSQKEKGTKLRRRLDEPFLSRHIEVKLLAVLPRCHGSRLPSGRRHISRTSQPCGQLQNCAAFMQLMVVLIKKKKLSCSIYAKPNILYIYTSCLFYWLGLRGSCKTPVWTCAHPKI